MVFFGTPPHWFLTDMVLCSAVITPTPRKFDLARGLLPLMSFFVFFSPCRVGLTICRVFVHPGIEVDFPCNQKAASDFES